MSLATKLRGALRIARGDSRRRYLLAERVAKRLHPEAVLGEPGKRWMHADAEFLATYARYYPAGIGRRAERLYALDQLVKLALAVPGDTVECGVWHGAASHFILARTQGTGRQHHMFDSWEGLSEPGAHDGTHWHKGSLSLDESVARENLAGFTHAHFYRGWVPERFPEVTGRRFAFVHADVDLYEPTRATLEFFYPRTNAGGVILCDDSGLAKCPGARLAVDEFFADKPREPVIELPTGQSFVIKA